MKRVMLSLVGGSCLLVAAVAISQTSVMVAQKASDARGPSGRQADPSGGQYSDKVCRDWPIYTDGTGNALFYCDEWLNFDPQGGQTCNDDPQAAYEYADENSTYPCDCSASDSDPYHCGPERGHAKRIFGGLASKFSPETDRKLEETQKVNTVNGVTVVSNADVLCDELQDKRYTYILAKLPTAVPATNYKEIPAIVFHVQVRNLPCSGKTKHFYIAYEVEPTQKVMNALKSAAPVFFDVPRQDQNESSPYHAFSSRVPFRGHPMLMLTYTAIKP